jgi:hypothetical protein
MTAAPEEDSAATEPSPAASVPHEAAKETLTAEVLGRYLATAVEDREAAEERSSKVIARFTKLTIAMMGLTTVVAGANLIMILREPSAAPPATLVVSRPIETQPVVAQPAHPALPALPALPVLPTAPPSEAQGTVRPADEIPLPGFPPAEKIPLLGSPPSEKLQLLGSPRNTRASQPAPVRLARPATTQTRPHPLLSARTEEDDDDSSKSGPVERW